MILLCYAYNLYPYLLATMVKQHELIVNEPPQAAENLIPPFSKLVPDLFREGAGGIRNPPAGMGMKKVGFIFTTFVHQ